MNSKTLCINPQLDKLELNEIISHKYFQIIGKRGTGKLYLLNNLIHYFKLAHNYNYVIVSSRFSSDHNNLDGVKYKSVGELVESDVEINSDTILIFFDPINYKSTNKLRLDNILSMVSKIIFVSNIIYNSIPIINTDSFITFLLKEDFFLTIKKMHLKLIDGPLDNFASLILKYTQNYGVVIINHNQYIKYGQAESDQTYSLEFQEADLYYNCVKKIITKIELGHSMFHTIHGDLYSDMQLKLNEIMSMIYAKKCLELAFVFPTELNLLIIQLMIDITHNTPYTTYNWNFSENNSDDENSSDDKNYEKYVYINGGFIIERI